MINFIKRMFRRDVGRGWIKVKPGELITLKQGQKFDTLHKDGVVVHGWIYGKSESRIGSDGDIYTIHAPPPGRTAFWSWRVKAYRIAEPEALAADAETRARRENLWRDLAANPQAPVNAPVGPLRRKRVRG